jgi:AraC family transcriptional regulator of adaptative response/methylated-DNA-[protein]-cysteine methyltransferase
MRKASEKNSQAEKILADPRWTALISKNKESDGDFFYSVRTTGVYCRPSCGARMPRPENVEFHATTGDAEAAGFRPCQRCQPAGLSLTDRNKAKIAKACRIIEQQEERINLHALAKTIRMSPYHFHRTFKNVTGLTPAEYAHANRSERVRKTLTGGQSVTTAIYDAGYNSSSRFYEKAGEVLGMTPSAFQEGGTGTQIHFALAETSLGSLLVGMSQRGVCSVLLGDDPDQLARELQDQFPKATLIGGDQRFEAIVSSVVGLVESPGLGHNLPLDIQGTAFQQRVWNTLLKIPAGTTATYTDIARMIGMPNATRAVAQACGANRLAVAIPCHRVIRSDGSLSGYRWGVVRKRALLDREAR